MFVVLQSFLRDFNGLASIMTKASVNNRHLYALTDMGLVDFSFRVFFPGVIAMLDLVQGH